MNGALKLCLLWLLLGWTIPFLILGVCLFAVLGSGWTGDQTNIFYQSDPDVDAAFDWCITQLSKFFTKP